MAALKHGASFLGAFLAARRERRGGDRAALLRRQERRLRHFLGRVLPRAPFYRPFAGRPLAALPIVGKAQMLEHFAAINTRGIRLDSALAVALEAEGSRDFAPRLDGLTVGLSSGTSGSRGVFLVSDGERARWAGLLLGRLLGSEALRQLLQPWRPRLRIAFFLRANSNLYTTLDRRRLDFRFYDLTRPFAELVAELAAHGAEILVAPATVLAALAAEVAAGRLALRPLQVISVAEVLEADEKEKIAAAFGPQPAQIYQATEGFLGSSCEIGNIHLHEEEILIEPEFLDEERRRFQPILTDLRRETQLIVRYRLDDILRLADNPCACGRPTLAIAAIEGRADDVFRLEDPAGRTLEIFPDVLRRMMALAGDGIADYRLEQRPDGVRVALRLAPGEDAAAAEARVERQWSRLLEGIGIVPRPIAFFPFSQASFDHKRRRIRRYS